jgi:hypothetical protein
LDEKQRFCFENFSQSEEKILFSDWLDQVVKLKLRNSNLVSFSDWLKIFDVGIN